MIELWLPAPGYEGRYEVSSLGRIRSLPRTETASNGHRRAVRGGVLKPVPNIDGYPHVSLRCGGKLRLVRLHRLVALAFHSDKRNDLHNEVAHLDGNRGNARADNLQWVSKIENHFHRRAHGTAPVGELHPGAKLTDAKVLEILASKDFATVIAARFGISHHTVSGIRRGRSWKHLQSAIAQPPSSQSPSNGDE